MNLAPNCPIDLGILRKRGLIREEGKRIIANDMLLS